MPRSVLWIDTASKGLIFVVNIKKFYFGDLFEAVMTSGRFLMTVRPTRCRLESADNCFLRERND